MVGTATGSTGAAPRRRREGLWRHHDFLNLWAAQSVSLVGSQITLLALPLAAALQLRASPVQMGLLAAAAEAPFLLASLPAGVWVDRARRRPLLVAADLGRALLLLSVPLAAVVGTLRIEQLYAVAFGVGLLNVLFDVAHYAYVPALLPRDLLVDGNSKLQVSYSVADSAGPGLAGGLVQLLSAPAAVLVDAATYLVSALLLRRIKTPEAPPQPATGEGLRRQIAEGLRALLGHPLLRPIVLASAVIGLFARGVLALYVLFATRELGIGPATLGLVFAAGGVGAIPGAFLAARAARRFGTGPVILGGWFVGGLALLLVPIASGPWAVPLLAASQLLAGGVGTVANVNQWSLRQAVTPDHLQGRVTAGHRFLVYGAEPVGALLAGFLAAGIGLRPALLVCALGAAAGPLVALFSPLRRLREQPSLVDDPTSSSDAAARTVGAKS